MEQLRLELLQPTNAAYMNHTIYQPETCAIPWAVRIEGWSNGKKDITIYHDSIGTKGYAHYPNLRIKDAREFAEFTVKMLQVWETFNKSYIEVRSTDLLALMVGYEKGEKLAQARPYIECVNC